MIKRTALLMLLVLLSWPALARVHLLHGGQGSLAAVIARTAPGDTIVVDGVVREGPVTIDRPLCLLGLPGVGRIRTSIALQTVKQTHALPLDHLTQPSKPRQRVRYAES